MIELNLKEPIVPGASRRPPLRLLTLGLALLLGAGLLGASSPAAEEPPAREEASAPPAPAPAGANAQVTVCAPAVLEPPSRLVGLGSPVQGRLAAVLKREGDPVRRGEVVARLEDGPQRAALATRRAEAAQAEARLARLRAGARPEELEEARGALAAADARLALARLEAIRLRGLVREAVAQERERDAAIAEYRLARAERRRSRARLDLLLAGARSEDLDAARAGLERARALQAAAAEELARRAIRSPLDGRCVERVAEPGEVVGHPGAADRPVLTVAADDGLRLRAEVDARDLGAIAVGRALARVPAFPGEELPGRVLRVARVAGRKNLRTERPRERIDAKVVEVTVALDPHPLLARLPYDLEVTAFFLRPSQVAPGAATAEAAPAGP